MGAKYSVEFDEELSTKVFSCSKCKNLLVPPIMCVVDLGDICSPCFQEMNIDKKDTVVVENKSLEAFLRKMYFPCQYHWHGCTKKISYNDLQDHENNCIYRTISCVFPTCNWMSCRLDMKMHFVESHKEKILPTESDQCIIETNILEDSDASRMYDTTTAVFIIRIKVNVKEKKLKYVIYDIDNEAPNYSFKIDHIYDNESYSNLAPKIVHDNIDKFSLDDEEATEVDLSTFKINPNAKIIKTIIKIWENNVEPFDDEKVKLFECPVCNELMRAPIYQCTTGHSICSSCKQNLQNCPMCKSSIGTIRNYTLEDMSQFITYPCKYKGNGCRVKTVAVANHEFSCYYKDYACPIPGCKFKGRYGLFLDHLREEHGPLCFSKNIINLSSRNNTTSNQVYCTLIASQVFKITLNQDPQNINFAVEYVIPSENTNDYMYEFSIIDNNKTERILAVKQSCTLWSVDKVTVTHRLSKSELVNSFADENHMLHYRITIYRSGDDIENNVVNKNEDGGVRVNSDVKKLFVPIRRTTLYRRLNK